MPVILLSRLFALATLLCTAAIATFAHAYDERDAVKARFPDPPVHYQTPAAPLVVTSRQKARERTLAMLDPVTDVDRR